ncbi:hypothetical protein QZH56_00680 [Streptomyces olivoreticuli]|uniref:hypothetical protein n=1 Tax=Streptomyces olivoreticuli TaxID=68246 RepID=UPI00265B2960|nr:hypothetical protein [Streptomyces olivoreticuli]WKK24230.1 hypothetical protein QZH56_00680 [Streptomyces olivoreticuli]
MHKIIVRYLVATTMTATAIIPLAGLAEAAPNTPTVVSGEHCGDRDCGGHSDWPGRDRRESRNMFEGLNFLNNILNFESFNS